jgi:hypothetical protein
VTVNPGGEEEPPDPDAEETDVFLVLGADRRARKAREEEQETPETSKAPGSPRTPEDPEPPEPADAPEARRQQESPPHRGESPFAPETEETASGGPEEDEEDTVSSPEDSGPARPDTDTVLVQAPPSAEAEQAGPAAGIGAPPEAGTAVSGPAPRETAPEEAVERSGPGAGQAPAFPGSGTGAQEWDAPYPGYGDRPPVPTGFPDIPAAPYAGAERPEADRAVPRAEGRLDLPAPYSPAPEPSARGIESWIDAVDGGHTPVQGGYEQRIAAVKSVPSSPWRRAVFAVTGGRINPG